jgi:hypothetical protein
MAKPLELPLPTLTDQLIALQTPNSLLVYLHTPSAPCTVKFQYS